MATITLWATDVSISVTFDSNHKPQNGLTLSSSNVDYGTVSCNAASSNRAVIRDNSSLTFTATREGWTLKSITLTWRGSNDPESTDVLTITGGTFNSLTSITASASTVVVGSENANNNYQVSAVSVVFTEATPPCLAPTITTQPASTAIELEATNPELSITATDVSTYAWKESSDGTAYDGESVLSSSSTYTPAVNDKVQTKYYYCELTSECGESTKSNIVTINVVASIVHVTGVSLDITEQEFTLGGTVTETLTATVSPNDASDKSISWESDKPAIVSVTDNGDGTAEIEALTEGTATITVTTVDGSYTATCDVTVNPNPNHMYFWFSKAGDAEAANVINNEDDFFSSLPSGSSGITGSITIDGIKYDVTQRSSNTTANVQFTIPANKSGKLYAVIQGSSGRSIILKKGDTTVESITWENSVASHDFAAVGSGTYTVTSSGNVGWGMLAVKVCDNPGPGTAIDNTDASVKAVKVLRDGQLFIEKNGHVYDAFGTCVK